MRYARVSTIHMLLCTCATAAFAQQAPPGDAAPASAATTTTTPATSAATSAEIKKWMTQLGDEDWRVREAAQRSLADAGDGVLAPLGELAAKTDDPEVKQRAEAVIRRLDAARAKRDADARRRARGAADLLEASLVTLKFDHAPVRDVYDALAEQASAPIKTLHAERFWAWQNNRQNDKAVTINLEKVPFWEAVDALEQQTGLTLRERGGEMVLDTADVRRDRGPVFMEGPFKIVAVETGMPGRYQQLKVFVEPKLRVLSYAMEADVEAAIDAQGQPVAVGGFMPRGGGIRAPGPHMHPRGGNAFDVRLPLDITPHQIAQLKGSVRAKVLLREDVVEIDNMAKANNVDRVIDGRRFMVNLMTPEPGEHLVTLIAYELPAPAFIGAGIIKARLIDDDGDEFQAAGSGSSSNGKRLTCNFTFRDAPGCGKPSKLILPFPAETGDITIPFEFGKRPAAN